MDTQNSLVNPTCHNLNPEWFAKLLLPSINPSFTRMTTLTHLAANAAKERGLSQHIWCVQTPSVKDPDGWFVIHWTRAVRAQLQSVTLRRSTDQSTRDYMDYLLREEGSDALQSHTTQVRRAFEGLLPPGAVHCVETDAMRYFLSRIDSSLYDDSIEKTVFRLPVLHSGSASTSRKLAKLLPFVNARKVPHELVDVFPPLLKLLHHALVHYSDEGYRKWGLFWTRKGLVFYPVRAVQAAKNLPALYEEYALVDPVSDVMVWTLDEAVLHRSLPLMRSAPLYKYLVKDLNYISDAADPLTQLLVDEPDAHRKSKEYKSEYAFLVPTTGAYENTLTSYYEKLLDPARTTPARLKKIHNSSTLTLSSNPKKKAKRFVQLGMRADALGYNDRKDPKFFEKECANPTYLSMCLTYSPTHDTQYVTYPLELISALPELTKKDAFRYRESEEIRITDPTIGLDETAYVTRSSFKGNATIYSDGYLFLHPSLLIPYGEAYQVAKKILEIRRPTSTTIAPLLEAFNNFCLFLYDSQTYREQRLDLPPWLDVTTDPESGCPIQLDTTAKKLNFLAIIADNSSGSKAGVAYMPRLRDGGQDIRSGKLTDFDRFAIWYSAKKEMQLLNPPVTLNTRQLREYICYRWLPWRRPDSLRPHMVSGKFLRDDPELDERPILPPQLPLDTPIADFVANQVANGRLTPLTS